MSTQTNPTPAEHSAPPNCLRPTGRQLVWSIVFGLTLIAALILVRRFALPVAVQYLITVLPVIAGGLYMNALVRDVRRNLDELQLRIYLEAAAIVVCGLFVLMCTYPLLQAVHLVGPLDWGIVLILMGALGATAYFRAVRRYR